MISTDKFVLHCSKDNCDMTCGKNVTIQKNMKYCGIALNLYLKLCCFLKQLAQRNFFPLFLVDLKLQKNQFSNICATIFVRTLVPLSWTHPPFSLPRSPCSPARLSTFCPCLNISHCCCRWCVIQGTERSLCTQCGCCGMQVLGVWCVVTGVWPLTPARRLPVCLFSYTWPALTLTYPYTHTHTHRTIQYVSKFW